MDSTRLNAIVNEHFGTREYFSRKMKVSRWTAYRWLKNPERMGLADLRRLSTITGKPLKELV
jgi:predicted transcriptional regulator